MKEHNEKTIESYPIYSTTNHDLLKRLQGGERVKVYGIVFCKKHDIFEESIFSLQWFYSTYKLVCDE